MWHRLFGWIVRSGTILGWLLANGGISLAQTQSVPLLDADIDFLSTGEYSGLGNRKGGTTMGAACGTAEPQDFVAIVPIELVGTTTEARPTFWFHVPFDSDNFHSMEFVLLDEHENVIGEPAIVIKNEALPGIVSFPLPVAAGLLETGRFYQVDLVIFCEDPEEILTPLLVSVRAWVVRQEISDELQRDLDAARTEGDRAVAYANHGIWHEALTIVGQFGNQQDWAALMRDPEVGLDEIADRPIVDCCTISPSN